MEKYNKNRKSENLQKNKKIKFFEDAKKLTFDVFRTQALRWNVVQVDE